MESLASNTSAFIEHYRGAPTGQMLRIEAFSTSMELFSDQGCLDEVAGTAPPLATAPEPSPRLAKILLAACSRI